MDEFKLTYEDLSAIEHGLELVIEAKRKGAEGSTEQAFTEHYRRGEKHAEALLERVRDRVEVMRDYASDCVID